MSKQDLLKTRNCTLKVNIHCYGCAQKIKKLLQKIDGVYSLNIDAEQGKVLVVGDVDPAKLIKKLESSGKHAEIWGDQRSKNMMYNNQNHPINHQFQNLQVHNSKGGKDNKSQNHKGQKEGGGGGGQGQLAHFQNNTKGAQDLKVPPKGHKSVKFNLPEEEFEASDDGYYDEFEDNFDLYDEEEEEGYGHGHPMDNKIMRVMGNGGGPRGPAGMMNGPPAMSYNYIGSGGGGGNYNNGSGKKGHDVIDMAMQIKGKGGNHNEAKNGSKGGKKNDGDQRDKNNKKGGGGGDNKKKKKSAKSEGGLLGRFLGFGKKSKKGGGGGADTYNYKNKSKYNGGKEEKKGEGKLEGNSNNKGKSDFDLHDYDDIPPHEKNGKRGKGSKGNGNVGQMGPMDNIPAMNGGDGYHQGMQMQPPPTYNLEQQQYMAMMMNQQRLQQQGNMNNMYPPAMMYGGPSHASMNYMPPPLMPSHPMADPITHTFSDENVESCSIM